MRNRIIKNIGIAILIFTVTVALLAPLISPYSPTENNVARPLQRPGEGHVLGTNDIGQDIFSELIYGTRISLLVGSFSALIALVIGTTVGMISGWFGGWIDRLLMKITTFFITIPFIPSVIILSTFTKAGVFNMSIILGVMSWPEVARVLRSQTIKIKSSDYINAIQAMGAGNVYILRRHILRELMPLIMYRGVARMKSGILMEASMSFLGLGNPVAKSWGSMIYYAQAKNALLTGAWVWWVIPPGICICLVCMALMLISYSLEGANSGLGGDKA